MPDCYLCGRPFRDNYGLNRHLSRKTPCISKINLENTSINSNSLLCNSDSLSPNSNSLLCNSDSLSPNSDSLLCNPKSLVIDSKSLPDTTCTCCCKIFLNVQNRKKHDRICKLKDDSLRLLEIELGIVITVPTNKLQCRFCNKVVSRSDKLNDHYNICIEKFNYQSNLLEQKDLLLRNKQTQINNNSNNIIGNNNTNTNNNTNNTTNNFFSGEVLNFGSFDDSHITDEHIENKLNKHVIGSTDPYYVKAGKLIVEYEQDLSLNPVNNNIKNPHKKNGFSMIKTKDGNKIVPTNRLNNTKSMITARKLKNRIQTYGETHETNSNILHTNFEIEEIGKTGIYLYVPDVKKVNEDQLKKIKELYTNKCITEVVDLDYLQELEQELKNELLSEPDW